MAVLVTAPPCVLYEDEHILVVNKPAGVNTHSPSPYAGEGIYDWLRNRDSRWARLAIIHRLDKVTSGLLLFAKTPAANKSLTEQFANRTIQKSYRLLTDRKPPRKEFVVQSGILRTGEKYSADKRGEPAETRFHYVGTEQGFHSLIARPITGRTHQIRVHCEKEGIPIIGDALYGGRDFPRVCLHSEDIHLRHPGTQREQSFRAEANFFEDPSIALRKLVIEPDATIACRLLHGAADHSSIYLDRWGDHGLSQSESSSPGEDQWRLEHLSKVLGLRGIYHKVLNRDVGRAPQKEAAPQFFAGSPAPSSFTISENGVKFEISFEHGYSVGLFLDQRDNRRRLLQNYIAPGFELFPEGLKGRAVLNAFAYTCGFSVCAALAGAKTTSLDLSRKYLEWGERNFRLNGLDPQEHDFIYGDVFDWAQRLRKKNRRFDLIILDPPTFSRGEHGVFQAHKHFGDLVGIVLPLLEAGGVLLVSTNAHKLPPEKFLREVSDAVREAGRRAPQAHYVPQPLDFPITGDEPAYLKTSWFRVA